MFKMSYFRILLINAVTVVSICITSVASSDTISIIANPESPFVDVELNNKTVKDIFLGKITKIKGHSVEPINQAAGRPITVLFNEAVVGKNENKMRAYWSRMVFSGKGSPPPTLDDDQAVKIHVSNNKGALSYIKKSSVDDTVKVMVEVTP